MAMQLKTGVFTKGRAFVWSRFYGDKSSTVGHED